MRKIIVLLTCLISILVMNAAILNDRLFHKESYGEEFYGDSTPLSKTFEDVCVINWSARSYFSGIYNIIKEEFLYSLCVNLYEVWRVSRKFY